MSVISTPAPLTTRTTGRPDEGRTPGGDVITVIRRRPHPPMQGDDRLGRRLSRAWSTRRSARSAR